MAAIQTVSREHCKLLVTCAYRISLLKLLLATLPRMHYSILQCRRFEFDNEQEFRFLNRVAVNVNRHDSGCTCFNPTTTQALEMCSIFRPR
jgi:hypothetical protein